MFTKTEKKTKWFLRDLCGLRGLRAAAVGRLSRSPVNTPDDLSDAAAGVERGVDVRVGRGHTERILCVVEVRGVIEVDVVEQVQRIEPDFDAHLSAERELFRHADIEAREDRGTDNQRARCAVAGPDLQTGCRVGGRDVAPFGYAEVLGIAGERG